MLMTIDNLTNSLKRYSQKLSDLIASVAYAFDYTQEVSIFQDEQATTNDILSCFEIIRAAFPDLPPEWYKVVSLRLKFKKFSRYQLYYATIRMIDTIKYPKPTPANLLAFDIKIKIIPEKEIFKHIQTMDEINEFEKIKSGDKIFYISKNQLEQIRNEISNV